MARAEDSFFDDLARGLADGSLTRGKALRLMGAAVVGGTLGSLGMGEASADPIGCKRNGKTCTRNTQCCSGNCSGGTCQAQTTTTTTTTPTTTTTSTTTTTPTPEPLTNLQACGCTDGRHFQQCVTTCEAGLRACQSFCTDFGAAVADADTFCITDDPTC
jgi:hypothetical protein